MTKHAQLLMFSASSIALVAAAGWVSSAEPVINIAAAKFSDLKATATLPAAFKPLTVPNIPPNQFSMVDDAGITVLKVESNQSASTVSLPLQVDPLQTGQLSWRWKVNRTISKADINTKAGDDFAARVYVIFDVPLESLSFTDRTKIRLARFVSGADVPTAAICYVWDNKSAIGLSRWSPYTDRVRIIVLQSGDSNINQWQEQSRDVAADFRAAFGSEPPRVTAVAIGSDTDQTKEQVTSWFGDFVFRLQASIKK